MAIKYQGRTVGDSFTVMRGKNEGRGIERGSNYANQPILFFGGASRSNPIFALHSPGPIDIYGSHPPTSSFPFFPPPPSKMRRITQETKKGPIFLKVFSPSFASGPTQEPQRRKKSLFSDTNLFFPRLFFFAQKSRFENTITGGKEEIRGGVFSSIPVFGKKKAIKSPSG